MVKLKPLTVLFFFVINLSSASANQVLSIGDSQSAGYLGQIIYEALESNGHGADVYGVSSSSPRHWGSPGDSWNGRWLCNRTGRHNQSFEIPLKDKICRPNKKKASLQILLEGKNYSQVIVQFLGNSAHLSKKDIVNNLNQLLDIVGKRNCLFVTSPPHFARSNGTNIKRKQVEEIFVSTIGNRCKISLGMSGSEMEKFSKDPSNYIEDKVHLSKKGARLFFDLKINKLLIK